MSLNPVNKQSFSLKQETPNVYGENVYVIKGGSTVVGDNWVHFNDIVINIKQVISDYLLNTSRRIFNQTGGILYVLITMDVNQNLTVIPSVSFNKNTNGDIKIFPDLSGLVPLLLVKLTQDGSAGLTGINDIQQQDIEEYKGYGNFTLRGPYGDTGPIGNTGLSGLTGNSGITGFMGPTGSIGNTGISGIAIQGDTGPKGLEGNKCFWPTVNRVTSPPIANFVASPTTVNPPYALPVSIAFTDLSIPVGQISYWAWDFGDGQTSTSQNPVNLYQNPGTYTVSLTVSNEEGDSQDIKVGYIVITENVTIQDVVDPNVETWEDDVNINVDIIQDSTM